MCKRNTDVAASIAGYYYQILLACREITSNQGNIQAVGIEAGADIRLLLINNDKVSIEAKFHKEKMTKYCDDIVKTVYNFYVSSYSDRQLVFSTNVAAGSTSAKFFSKWDTDLALDEKVKFVKECILRKSIEVTGIYKMNYNKYLESYTGSEKEKIK